MLSRVKSTLLHIRVNGDSSNILDTLGGNLLSRQQVASMILEAACEAVRQNGGKLDFPPKFNVGDKTSGSTDFSRLNQPPASYKAKR